MKKYIVLLFISLLGFAQQTPAPKQNKSILIIGAKAHLGNGEVIENSLISIIDGKIATIGDATLMKPAKHDIIIEAAGKHVYPGFIAPNSTLGLVEIDAVRASDDESEIGEFNPHVRSIIAYNTESVVTETTRPNGVLLAQITPRGGRISGTSSIVQLDAWNWEDAIIKENDGIHLNWPRSYSRTGWWAEPGGIEANKNYEPQIKTIQDYFDNAFAYLNTKNSKKDIPFEAMKGIQNGEKKLYIHVNGEKEIIDAVLFKKKNNIKNMVIVGGYYAFKVATLLKENNVAVLLKRVHDLPLLEDEDVNLPYKNAKLLVDAGVLVGLENAGDMERMQTRNLPFYAGTCAAWGLSKEQALQLITENTAKILGIDNQYGTLESGKSATLFISEGDPLEMKTNVISFAFIDGRQISLQSHHTELYERYKGKFEQQKK
ncbi:MAG: amidohydrolase family protein [Flavobacterium sp.]|uniref:Amidohydrolase family protein n=1 Tax=Flavobacterium celericrescens TaxID=2709780 RepID=A0ABX0IC19_9FLAO|nr:amidohydrolase family protein [Flavobacterium celericrescens]NHM03853.1 amidohydrolase family protein [Flavobacterium celericrescens]